MNCCKCGEETFRSAECPECAVIDSELWIHMEGILNDEIRNDQRISKSSCQV